MMDKSKQMALSLTLTKPTGREIFWLSIGAIIGYFLSDGYQITWTGLFETVVAGVAIGLVLGRVQWKQNSQH
jgi:hypothetical protein